jgi:hypothetical protein
VQQGRALLDLQALPLNQLTINIGLPEEFVQGEKMNPGNFFALIDDFFNIMRLFPLTLAPDTMMHLKI